MHTWCGSGCAITDDTIRAVTEAVAQASGELGEVKPRLAFLFVSAARNLAPALDAAARALPGADIVGCTSFGELTGAGSVSGGVSCLLVAWHEAEHRVVFVPGHKPDAAALCGALCVDLEAQIARAAARGLAFSTSVLFGDGLSPQLEQVVTHARKVAPEGHAVVGAGAAADGVHDVTAVGAGNEAAPGGSVVVHVCSRRKWGIGVGHGVHPASPHLTVTRARGNIVYEIDERPAFDVYREHVPAPPAGDLASLPNLAQNELGVVLFDSLVRVRAPLSVTADGALACAGEVPEGSTICVVRGAPDEMIAAAGTAAREAAEQLAGPAAGVLVFSCMCRRLSLGARYDEEVSAIRAVFPDVPIAGFLSYGEIAQTPKRLDGYHNNTVVVVAIPR